MVWPTTKISPGSSRRAIRGICLARPRNRTSSMCPARPATWWPGWRSSSRLDDRLMIPRGLQSSAGRSATARPTTPRAARRWRNGLVVRVDAALDVAFEEILVVLLAGVLHDLPIRPQREYPSVLPGLGVVFRVVDGDFVRDVPGIGPGEALHRAKLIAVRVAYRVEPRLAVKVHGIDHQGIPFPVADRIAKPGPHLVAVRTPVDVEYLKPRILFVQQRQILITLHDLNRIGRVHRADQPERQTAARVVALGWVIGFPDLLSFWCKWKFLARRSRRAFGRGLSGSRRRVRQARVGDLVVITRGDRHVGNVRPLPHSAEVRLAVQAGRCTFWGFGPAALGRSRRGCQRQQRDGQRCLADPIVKTKSH